jgi:hypothetical protein
MAHPQLPFTHEAVQHSESTVQVAPMIEQLGPAGSQRAGLPAQTPVQQSSFVAHAVPVATHGEVQAATPASLVAHDPLQHVWPPAHGASRGRQGPGPNMQRPLAVSQPPQQGGTSVIPLQVSPGSRQMEAVSRHTFKIGVHSPEQHWPFELHEVPAGAQSAGPHVPWSHPSEQQSEARAHAVPSMRQYGAHCLDAETETSTGSHRPLQQSLRAMQSAPAPAHDPA